MNILFVLPDFPFPPSTGGRSKVFNELLFLSKNHQCDLLCIGNISDELRHGLKAVLPNVNLLNVVPPPSAALVFLNTLWNVIRLRPVSLAKFTVRMFSNEMTACLEAKNYDVIHYDIVNMAQYLPLGAGIPSVHSPNDATSLVYSRLAKQTPWSFYKLQLLLSAALLKRYERKVYPSFTTVHVVSEIDAEYLRDVHPGIRTVVIPIALNIDPLSLANEREKDIAIPKNGACIICAGNFGNSAISSGALKFINEEFPAIVKNIPDVRLIVLGKNADVNLLKQIDLNKNIEHVEWVEDYNKFLMQADIVLAPDRTGAPGAKTRVLQAMGLRLLVIGTRSAFEGIPVTNFIHGVMYETMPECAEMIVDLLTDSDKRLTIAENGYVLAEEQFSLEAVGPRYESMYLDAIQDHSVAQDQAALT